MIEFTSRTAHARFADPRDGFRLIDVPCEIRVDPLTGTHTRVAHLGLPPRHRRGLPPELEEYAPGIFAPPLVEQVTPTFPDRLVAGGRLTRGRSVLFPNLFPYERFSPVVAVGDRVYVEAPDLDPKDVEDALILLRDFFTGLPRSVAASGVVGWNFLPAAGSSIPHPHLQAIASGRTPDRQRRERRGELAHRRRTGNGFWDDLTALERKGPRWLGKRRNWSAMTAFASRSVVPETWIVHRDATDLLDASDAALGGLAEWVCRLATAHHEHGIYSFNLIATPTGPQRGSPSRFRARYLPRLSLIETTGSSDQFWVNLGTEEGMVALTPEEWAETLRTTLD